VRHSGAYDGQSTVVALDPAAAAGVVVMTNSLNGHAAVAGVLDSVPVPWAAEPAPADLSPYAGRYRSGTTGDLQIEVSPDGGLTSTVVAFDARGSIHPVDRGTFVGPGGSCAFFGFDAAGVPEYLRFQMRVLRRVDD
jgi:hypothetical protein